MQTSNPQQGNNATQEPQPIGQGSFFISTLNIKKKRQELPLSIIIFIFTSFETFYHQNLSDTNIYQLLRVHHLLFDTLFQNVQQKGF